jgi:MinD-like ATPase involved in chromosome partitioning or flagellar assembly
LTSIISIHSFRGGTGKSNTTANLAVLLAQQGKRVCVIDTDIQSPGIHVLFGLAGEDIDTALNDYLWHGRDIKDVALDVTSPEVEACNGRVFLVPSSIKPGEITRVLRDGYDAQQLTLGFRRLVSELDLDALLIDTHPGLNEETLLSLVISDALIIVMRPDQQDYEGTGITVKVAQQLNVPRILLVVNKIPPRFDADDIAGKVQQTYGVEVASAIPHSDDLMELASAGIFALTYPQHPITEQYRHVASRLLI